MVFNKYVIRTAASEIGVWQLPSLAMVFTNFEGLFETAVVLSMYAVNLKYFEMTASYCQRCCCLEMFATKVRDFSTDWSECTFRGHLLLPSLVLPGVISNYSKNDKPLDQLQSDEKWKYFFFVQSLSSSSSSSSTLWPWVGLGLLYFFWGFVTMFFNGWVC